MGQFFHSPIQFLSCVVRLSIGVNILSMESVCGLPKEKTVTQRKSLGGGSGYTFREERCLPNPGGYYRSIEGPQFCSAGVWRTVQRQ